MKLLHQRIDPDSSGTVALIPEESEDLWQLYNLVALGDTIKANTYRNVARERTGGTIQKERKKIYLTLQVTKDIDYDAEGDEIRFAGVNSEQSEWLALGANHTISLHLHEKIEVEKENWDSVFLNILREATDSGRNAEVCCLLLDQVQGLAQFFLLTASLAKVVHKVQVTLPKNRRFEKANYDKALTKFYEQIRDGLLTKVNFAVVKCCVVAGPGFLKSEFLKWLKAGNNVVGGGGGARPQDDLLAQTEIPLSQLFEAPCSTANKQGLAELLADEAVLKKISNTKAFGQIRVLEDLYTRLAKDPDRACYGPRQTQIALEQGAVEKLLVTEALFRSRKSVAERRKYVEMVEMMARREDVCVFSDGHVAGEKLGMLSGIAALLRFPVPELDDVDSEEEVWLEEGGEEQAD